MTELRPLSAIDSQVIAPVANPLRLSWEGITYRVKAEVTHTDHNTGRQTKTKEWKTIIDNVNGCALPGHLLAIMGPSGAGKTTLLNIIAGRVALDKSHELSGCAYLNSSVLENAHKKHISFVAQDDIVMGKETPREALHFSYRMRTAASEEEATEQTERMLKKLHLEECANTILGIPGLVKGVSGGEKKRTNIGSELIRNPLILMLDEPTTGLDSVNARRVGELLRDLAHKEGRTVLCTIHSPSSELFNVFDDLLLLGHGRVMYSGPRAGAPAYFASIGHQLPVRYNPAEFYMNILQIPQPELGHMLDQWSAHILKPQPKNQNELIVAPFEPVASPRALLESQQQAGPCLQLGLLLRRAFRMYLRDPAGTIGRTVQTLFFAILIGLFFFKVGPNNSGVQDRNGALFIISINTIFMSIMSGIASFPPERAVFLMEQSNEVYSPWIYFFAKSVAELPFQILFPTVFACIVYFMVGLVLSPAAFFTFWIILVCASNCANSFGQFTASFFPAPEMAMAFVPMVMLPMFIVAGLFANTSRLDPNWIWLDYISFVRYTYTALLYNEYDKVGQLCDPGQHCSYQNGQQVLSYLGFSNILWGINVMAICIIMVGLRLLAACALAYQGWSRHSNMTFLSLLKAKTAVGAVPYGAVVNVK